MKHTRTAVTASLPVLLAALLGGCSGGDVMAAIGLPTSHTAEAHGKGGAAPPGPAQLGGQSKAVVVTSKQRAYLDALAAAGIKRSSDLRALSIGSYVCQARAANQTDREVWDFVLPLVRNDVHDGRLSSTKAPSAADVDAATADYIRIATERLC